MDLPQFPAPSDGILLTYTLIVKDVKRSCDWYKSMLDGEIVMEPTAEGTPCVLKAANSWIIINVGGGDPTEDKPTTDVKVKEDQTVLSSFLNVRVADARALYPRISV